MKYYSMDTQKIESGQNGQMDEQKFEKLVNEIKKKMNLKLYENEFIEIYEPEILINGMIFININQKNEIYSQGVKSFILVHDFTENDFYLKLIFDNGFSVIAMSIIKKLKILISTLNNNVGVE